MVHDPRSRATLPTLKQRGGSEAERRKGCSRRTVLPGSKEHSDAAHSLCPSAMEPPSDCPHDDPYDRELNRHVDIKVLVNKSLGQGL